MAATEARQRHLYWTHLPPAGRFILSCPDSALAIAAGNSGGPLLRDHYLLCPFHNAHLGISLSAGNTCSNEDGPKGPLKRLVIITLLDGLLSSCSSQLEHAHSRENAPSLDEHTVELTKRVNLKRVNRLISTIRH